MGKYQCRYKYLSGIFIKSCFNFGIYINRFFHFCIQNLYIVLNFLIAPLIITINVFFNLFFCTFVRFIMFNVFHFFSQGGILRLGILYFKFIYSFRF